MSQKGAVKTQTAIQTAIQTQAAMQIKVVVVMHSYQWSTIMRSNVFFQALATKMTTEQVLKNKMTTQRF